jgi:hypothetical protein
MLSRSFMVALLTGAMLGPVAAGQLSPEEARQFIAGKFFAFTCFDGSRGSGRIMNDGSVAGTIQFGGTGPVRLAHLPVDTIRINSTSVCASLKGIPFEPCFNVDKTDEVSFRGSVSGMGFAYCDFHKHGNAILETRSRVHGPRRLGSPAMTRSADASHAEVPKDLPKSEAKVEPKPEQVTLELRRSQE